MNYSIQVCFEAQRGAPLVITKNSNQIFNKPSAIVPEKLASTGPTSNAAPTPPH